MSEKTPLEKTVAPASFPEISEIQVAEQEPLKGDVALGFLKNAAPADGDVVLDKEKTARVLRKIDRVILPVLAITEMLQFLDKTTLSYASLFGIREDTGLHGNQFPWLTSILYIGYLISQPVSGFFLQRFPAAKCLVVCVFLWSVVLFMTATCSNWGGLMTVRFFLGFVEAVTFPAFMLINAGWYPRSAQPFRMGFWFSFNGIAQIVGGLLSYGLGHIESGIESWKWMFLVTGALTTLWSIALFFLLPNSQIDAWFLNDEEKRIAVEMVRANNTGIYNKTFKMEQLVEALMDVKSWLFLLLGFLINIPNSVATFGNLVISGFGYSSLHTTLLSMPAGAFEFVYIFGLCYICAKFPNARTGCILISCAVSLLGGILVLALPYHDKAGLLAGYYIIYAYPCANLLLFAMATANTAGHTKKVVVNAMTLVGFAVGNVAAPQFYKTSQAPRYGLGIGSLCVSLGLCFITYSLLWLYLVWQNKKRTPARLAAMETAPDNIEFMDLTDKQNPLFVYVY